MYWQLTALGAKCEVVAADALKLARNYRAGELTPVWVPDAAHERPCEIWCELGRRQRKTSYGPNIGWASFSYGMAGGRRQV